EKIRQLLSVREQFSKQKVALKNAIQAYSKQRVQVTLIKKAHQETLAQIEKQIARIDKELSFLCNLLTNSISNLKFHKVSRLPH
ncbi:unnamed protein product, partial [marine sediment metagenome]